jgi:hypothetical protein
MVDQPGQDDKGTAQETIFNSDIGDDWGEAFEAEDFMASPQEEVTNEFFLPDEHVAPTPIGGPVEGDVTAPATSPSPSSGRIALFYQALAARFVKTPIQFRLALVVLPILVLILILVLHKSPQTVVRTLRPLPPEGATVHPPLEKPTAQPHQPGVTALAPAPASGCKVPMPEPVTIRKKWRLPAIIAPAKAPGNDQTPIVLSADLTLVLKLTPEAIPPAGKDSFIREILYQFFTNQPLEDLKRYVIVRGEMNHKLQEWIKKQWPDLPLDSIIIDRYQLL